MLEKSLDMQTNIGRNRSLLDKFLVFLVALFPASSFFSTIFTIPFLGTPVTSIIRLSLLLFLFKKLFNKEPLKIIFFPLFFLWAFNILSILWSTEFVDTIISLTSLLQFFLIILIAGDAIRKKEDVDLIAFLYTFVSFFSMLFLFFMILTGFRPEEIDEYSTRLTVLGQDPNGLSYLFCINFVFIRDFFINEAKKSFLKRLWIKTLLVLPFLLTPIAVIATGSRTGFGIYLFVLITFLASKKSIVGVFFSIVFVAILMEFAGIDIFKYFEEKNIERVAGTTEEIREGDLTGRTITWKTALEIIVENPVLGTGFGTSSIEIGKIGYSENIDDEGRSRMATHNIFLQVLVETGFVGFLIFLISLYLMIKPIIKYSPRKSTWIIFYIASGIAGMTLSHVIYWPTFFMFAFIALKEIQLENNENFINN